MRRKLVLLSSLIVAALGPISYAGLVAYWDLEEGSGTTTTAVVGSPQANGRLVGATWITAGLAPISATKAAVFFKSTSADRMETNYPGVLGQAARSVTAWIRAEPTQANNGVMVGWGANATDQRYSVRINKAAADGALNALRLEIQGSRAVATTPFTDRQWHHIAVTHGAGARIGEVSFYVDGKLDARSGTPGTALINTASTSVVLGNSGHATATYGFDGALDEVRIYDHVLTLAEIQAVMKGVPPGRASKPNPADAAMDVPRDATLNWTAGESAGTHDVYFGTTFADVNTASRTDAKGALASRGQAETTFDPTGVFAYGQTYYWRIDEVNKTPDNTVFKGDVWSFTVERFGYPIKPVKATASSAQTGMGPEKTIDGSGLTGDLHGLEPTTMWLSTGVQPNWIQYEFDKVYKLHELQIWNSNQLIEAFVGFGAKKVAVEISPDGMIWTPVSNVPEFSQAPGAAGYAANTTVSLGSVDAKYVKLTIQNPWGAASQTGLSEVRFFYVPVQARAPEPATAATGVRVDTDLNWRPGREAASHKVSFGTDPNAIAQGTASAKSVTDHSFTPGSLNLGTTYYWKVDEVNAVTRPGDVWSFTTEAYKVVDDFESYTDKTGAEIFSTWADGYVDKSSGSQVGLTDAKNGTFGETTILHGGKQSMPLAYDNAAQPFYSEATWRFDTPQDWTANGIKSLSLYFFGDPNNSGQLYLKINNTKVLYGGAAADLRITAWLPWTVDLASTGANLQKVTKLVIGVEGTGAKGKLYIDDIRLYPTVPGLITPADPGTKGLVAHYKLDGDAQDSAGSHHGTLAGQAQPFIAGKLGQAFNVAADLTYITVPYAADLAMNSYTVAAWVNCTDKNGTRGILGTRFNGEYTFDLKVDAVRIHGDIGNGTAWLNSAVDVVTAQGGAITAGVWHHIAYAIDGAAGTAKLYLDGALAATVSFTGTPLFMTTGRELRLGVSYGTEYMRGAIDEVRLYNRALSAAEAAALAGRPGPVFQAP